MEPIVEVAQADREFARNWNFECKHCSEYEGDYEADMADAAARHRLSTPSPDLKADNAALVWPSDAKFQLEACVQKKGRASWRGHVVGWYRTSITALGYAVESAFEPGSVQIYPESALEPWEPRP